MTPARLQTVEEIFHAALDQEPKEIARLLSSACAGDEALRREVEALLGSHQRASTFIETSPASIATRIIETGQSDLLVGQTFGHYKISKRIGSGGMGEVYLATDVTAGRKAALKLLPMRFTGNADRLKRFQQEARAVVALNHPNILTVYEIGQDHLTHYIASELIEGETLRQRLARGHLQVSEAIDVAIQVASALATAHEAGIVHRDIKPENIMLRPAGYVKVFDFGVAKLAEQEAPATMPKDEALLLVETNLGSILGTVRYMSPEQASGAPVDKRTDIWSLGVVFYEMLTRHAPFTGDTPREAMASILEKEPPPLTSYNRQTPPELQQIIDKTLRKDRDERYPSVHGLLDALKNFRRKLEGESERAAAPLWLRWARSPATLVLVLTIATLALALPFYSHRSPMSSIPEKSIAVLPLVNSTGDPANEYFSDGMTEEIITALTKIEGLRVAARTSAFAFKGKRESVSEIGRQLRVGTVLERSVRRAGDRLRVTAQLVNVKDGYHLWAEAYDRDLRDVFAVQAEIAQAIAGALKVKLSGEAATMVARPTMDLTAYGLYLKGRQALNQRTGGSLVQAVAYFEQAIARDPRFAQAYAGLADAYVLLPGYSVTNSSEAWPKGRAAAERALALDSTLAEAHTTLAYGKFLFDWDWHAAEQGFRRAIALNPAYPTAHHWYGDFLGGRGNLEGYLQELRRAQALDPLSRQIGTEVGRALYALRRNDEAVAQLHQVLRADPAFAGAHVTLGRVYIQQGRLAEAIGEFQKAVELRGRNALDVAYLAYAYAMAGKRSEAQRLLVELEGRSRREYVPPTLLAIVYMGLGQDGRAFDWLDRAVAEHDGWLAEFIFFPTFDPLRSHPRYAPLLQALGLR